MGELVHSGSKYDDETRASVILEYSVVGAYKTVARNLKLPESTIRGMVKSDWGQTMLSEVRAQNRDRFISTSQAIIDKATSNCLEKLDDCSAKDSAVIGAVYYDKLRLALNQPSVIKSDSGSIQALAAAFRKLSADHQASLRVVSEQ